MTVSFLRHQARSNDKNQRTTHKSQEPNIRAVDQPSPATPNTNKNRAALTARPLTRLKVRLLHLLDGVGDLALGGGDRHLLTCTVAQQGLAKR